MLRFEILKKPGPHLEHSRPQSGLRGGTNAFDVPLPLQMPLWSNPIKGGYRMCRVSFFEHFNNASRLTKAEKFELMDAFSQDPATWDLAEAHQKAWKLVVLLGLSVRDASELLEISPASITLGLWITKDALEDG